VNTAWLPEAWLVVRAEEIFQQSKNKWYRSPEKAEGDKSACDSVTTRRNKMGAACKTSVALRAVCRTRTGTRTRTRMMTRWCVCKVMGQESSDVDV